VSAFRIDAIGQEELDRVQALLSGVEGGMAKVVREALSRAASHLRTTSVKAIREKYAISAAGIRDNETISISNLVGAGGNQVWIKFAGKKIPLYRYDGAAPATPTQDISRWVMAVISGQERWVHPGVAARGHVRKDTAPTQFESPASRRAVMSEKTRPRPSLKVPLLHRCVPAMWEFSSAPAEKPRAVEMPFEN